MKKYLFTLFFAINILKLQAQATVLKDDGAWFTFINHFEFTPKISVDNVTTFRRVHFLSSPHVTLVSPSFNYFISENIQIGLGYTSFTSFPYGSNSPSIRKHENRLWQHVTVKSKVGNLKFLNRFVFEERFKETINTNITPNIIDGTLYSQRFRYRVMTTFNLFKLNNDTAILGRVSNELRIRFKSGISQPDFDQDNFYLFLGCPILNNTTFWLGYGRDYYKVNSNLFISNNILHVALNYNLKLTKKT